MRMGHAQLLASSAPQMHVVDAGRMLDAAGSRLAPAAQRLQQRGGELGRRNRARHPHDARNPIVVSESGVSPRRGDRIKPVREGEARSACSREAAPRPRSEEHTSELQSLMRISYAVFCLKKKT